MVAQWEVAESEAGWLSWALSLSLSLAGLSLAELWLWWLPHPLRPGSTALIAPLPEFSTFLAFPAGGLAWHLAFLGLKWMGMV